MEPKETPVLTLVCPRCGKRFPSAMQMDPPSFAAIRVQDMPEHCSVCGHISLFRKDDYLFVTAPTQA